MKTYYSVFYEDEAYENMDAEETLRLVLNFVINNSIDGYKCDITESIHYYKGFNNQKIRIHELYIEPNRE